MESLVKTLSDLKEKEALELVDKMLNDGADPLEILNQCRVAMEEVGKKFEAGEYFIPDLIFSGEILKQISAVVKPGIENGGETEKIGKYIIGTVEGDIHDIGKNIVTFMLDVNGFEVYDLGVDVSPEKFVESIRETNAKVVGLSGLLTLAYDSMKKTVDAINEAGLRDQVKIMIGGSTINKDVVDYTGADVFGPDAMSAVSYAKEVLGV
ncbi:MAG TPA: cobalamin-dependent protein [Clostridia bacterium]|nr:cobalamin-dependent protein [Clostridia bacterium]